MLAGRVGPDENGVIVYAAETSSFWWEYRLYVAYMLADRMTRAMTRMW